MTAGARKHRFRLSTSNQARRYDIPICRPASEIEPCLSIISICLILPGPTARPPSKSPWICAVLEARILDAAEDRVEVSFANQEGIVLRPDRAFSVGKVKRDSVVQFDDVEMAEAGRRRPAQQFGQELG